MSDKAFQQNIDELRRLFELTKSKLHTVCADNEFGMETLREIAHNIDLMIQVTDFFVNKIKDAQKAK